MLESVDFFSLFYILLFRSQVYHYNILGMLGPTDVKQKGNESSGFLVHSPVLNFDFTTYLDFRVKLRNRRMSEIRGSVDM